MRSFLNLTARALNIVLAPANKANGQQIQAGSPAFGSCSARAGCPAVCDHTVK